MQLVRPSFKILASSFKPGIAPFNYGENWKRLVEVAGRTCYKTEDKITEESSEAFVNMLAKRKHFSVLEHSWRMIDITDTGIHYPRVNLKYIHPFISDKGRMFFIGSFRGLAEVGLSARWEQQSVPLTDEVPIGYHAMTVRFVCDRGVTHEIVRHRPASYSQESTRYVNYEGGCNFVIPPWVDISEGHWDDSKIHEIYREDPSFRDSADYFWMNEMSGAEQCYKALLKKGWSAQKARSVLPNSTKTEIVVTADVTEWRWIFGQRVVEAAHPQMREIMIPLLDKCKEYFPGVFDDI